jgi:hypothetical protein
MRSKKPSSLRKFLHRRQSRRFTPGIGAAILVTAGVCVAAAAILVAARQPSQPESMSTSKAQSPREAADPATKKALAQFGTTSTVSKALAHEPAAPVTITGCLERDAGTFRLEKTTGADAPKSRSWKSGFLKKRAASIEVVDAANRLQLPNQVGQRVSVMGVLVDREMRARSLQRVTGSCND